jgi:hypothetical protein
MRLADVFLPVERPAALVPLVLGAASIASLLLYFYGVLSMGDGARWLLLPALILLAVFVLAVSRRDAMLAERVVAGVWAGALATFAYDLVRVPIAASGVPVFKAISYFGTLILEQARPTLASEVAGWGYHLSNGIGFGLIYVMAVRRPRLWSALLWGVTLEAAMLATPYAEVFGYRMTPKFLAITIGSHLVFGAVLWAGLVGWERLKGSPRRRGWIAALGMMAPLGIGGVAVDFHDRHAAALPPSPPPYVGEHLYTTWNVPEPDRVALLWATRRFVDSRARFHYVEPFSRVIHGRPIDLPEAEVRRDATRSATEVMLEQRGLLDDTDLQLLAETTHLFEISRWRLPGHPRAFSLGTGLVAAVGECPAADAADCFERGFRYLDDWYDGRGEAAAD